jgi:hypothetical protein
MFHIHPLFSTRPRPYVKSLGVAHPVLRLASMTLVFRRFWERALKRGKALSASREIFGTGGIEPHCLHFSLQ